VLVVDAQNVARPKYVSLELSSMVCASSPRAGARRQVIINGLMRRAQALSNAAAIEHRFRATVGPQIGPIERERRCANLTSHRPADLRCGRLIAFVILGACPSGGCLSPIIQRLRRRC